jgi:hypothetical protein
MLAVLLMLALTASAQTGREQDVLSIPAYPGEATGIQSHRMYVDAQDLARITNGSLILALPIGPPSELACAGHSRCSLRRSECGRGHG